MEIMTKRGRVSTYGLACGYVEQAILGSVRVRLWQEHGIYHVRAHDRQHGRLFWESFRLLRDARKHFSHARALLLANAG